MNHNYYSNKTPTKDNTLTLQVYMNQNQLSELVKCAKNLAIKLLEKRNAVLNDCDLYGSVSCVSLYDQSSTMTFWERFNTFRTHVELSSEIIHEVLHNLVVFIGNHRDGYQNFFSDEKRAKKELRLMIEGNLINHSDSDFWGNALRRMKLNADQKTLLNSQAYPFNLERHFYPIENLSKARAMYYPDAIHAKVKQRQINTVFNNATKCHEIYEALYESYEMANDIKELSNLIFDHQKVLGLADPEILDLGIVSLPYSQKFDFNKQVKNLFDLVFDKYKDLV